MSRSESEAEQRVITVWLLSPPPLTPLLAPLSFASSHAQVHLDSDGATDTSGYTPLHYASRNGHASCVDLLIEHQVNLLMISP